jgi:hypothetical protein
MVLIEPSIGTLISHRRSGRRFDDADYKLESPQHPVFGDISNRLAKMHRVRDRSRIVRAALSCRGQTLLNDEYPLKSSTHRISFR